MSNKNLMKKYRKRVRLLYSFTKIFAWHINIIPPQEKDYTVGYKKNRADGSVTNKFATSMVLSGASILVLHLGKKHENIGLLVQDEIDKLIVIGSHITEIRIN